MKTEKKNHTAQKLPQRSYISWMVSHVVIITITLAFKLLGWKNPAPQTEEGGHPWSTENSRP